MSLYEETDTAQCPICNGEGYRYYYDCPAPFGTWEFHCDCGFTVSKDLHRCVNDQLLEENFVGGLITTEFDLGAEAEAFRRKIEGVEPYTMFQLEYLSDFDHVVVWPLRAVSAHH